MLVIAKEAHDIANPNNTQSTEDNPLVNAPHTMDVLSVDNWLHAYSRKQAVFPEGVSSESKYWPPVSRIDNVYGDKNLICSCPPMSLYEEA